MVALTAAPPATLQDFVLAEVHRQTSEAAIREKITGHIDKAVEDAIKSAFSYGDTRKKIESVVQGALAIEGGLNMPSYSTMVLALLRQKLNDVVADHVAKRLDEEMSEILELAPKEVKLSKVVEQMIEGLEMADRYGSSVTCIIEPSEYAEDVFHVYLDEEEDKAKYQCDVQMFVSNGQLKNLTVDKKDAKTSLRMGPMWGWKTMLFSAYCGASKFIVDEDHVSTGVGDF